MENIKKIQKKEISILKEFIKICEKYKLKYYSLGGTLLGAVRHEGFIPWDDDIDVGMPREDYEKFKEICLSELKKPYVCIHEDNTPSFTKAFMNIQDTSTKIIMNYSNVEKEQSLWIDIFPLDGMPKNTIKNFIHGKRYLFARMMVQLSQFNTIVNQNKADRPFYEKAIIKLANLTKIEKVLNYDKLEKKYNNVIKKYSFNEYYAGNYTGAYKLREIVPADFFGKPVKLKFEDIELNCPEKYKNYLTAIYGDNYMELPPVEKRQPHQYEIIKLD